MKIAFDARYIRPDHHDGISRFSARIASELASLVSAKGDELVFVISDERQLTHLPPLPFICVSSPTSVKEPWVSFSINKLSPDVLYSPMQTIGAWGKKYRLVLTIHDLIYYRYKTPPRNMNAFIRLLWRLYHLSWGPQKYLLSRSDAVVAVSETTKNIIHHKHLTTKPVYVVHNAADGLLGSSTPRAMPQSKDLIYMGSFMPYKNVETLVSMMKFLPGYTLHALSKISDKDRQRLEARDGSRSVIFHNGVDDDTYIKLLEGATALVSASRDEGFGIPLVEAMSVGTPIVVSDIDIFHEIGGDAALFAHCDEPEDFAQRILSLQDPALWLRRSQDSRRQASTFSWERSARELLSALHDVVGQTTS
jgi:glycosyltransferase involved in cell wall biosynthesis